MKSKKLSIQVFKYRVYKLVITCYLLLINNVKSRDPIGSKKYCVSKYSLSIFPGLVWICCPGTTVTTAATAITRWSSPETETGRRNPAASESSRVLKSYFPSTAASRPFQRTFRHSPRTPRSREDKCSNIHDDEAFKMSSTCVLLQTNCPLIVDWQFNASVNLV